MLRKPRTQYLLMSESINCWDDDISICYLLWIDFHCRHFLLPEAPLSILDFNLVIYEDIRDTIGGLGLTQHGWKWYLMCGHDSCNLFRVFFSLFEVAGTCHSPHETLYRPFPDIFTQSLMLHGVLRVAVIVFQYVTNTFTN